MSTLTKAVETVEKINTVLAEYEESKTAEPAQINGRTALLKLKES